jgi:uncharacterized protein (TIGR02569 family)
VVETPRPALDLRPVSTSTWRQRGPTPRAVQAFGVQKQALERLPGGQGICWTDGRIVLKPMGYAPEHRWVCQVYAEWHAHDDVRVAEPVAPRAADEPGGWSVDGWTASVFLRGRETELPDEVARVKEASDAFHHHIRDMPRPEFIQHRRDPWAFGDRLAWEDGPAEGDVETLHLIERLRSQLTRVDRPSQLIHGDILPNVLLADGQPPAVIDWPPYYRPVEMANAIAVTDAVTFRGAPLSLLDEWAAGSDWYQMLARALMYRLGPTGIFAVRNRLMGSLVTHVQRVRPVADVVLSRL